MAYTYKKMDPTIKAKWIAALRSGKYKQGYGCLYNRERKQYCCLGVLRALEFPRSSWSHVNRGDKGSYLHPAHRSHCGLSVSAEMQLATMNDSRQKFSAIADWIEKNL